MFVWTVDGVISVFMIGLALTIGLICGVWLLADAVIQKVKKFFNERKKS